MTGISILIVDDDKLLVEKLEKTMNWKKLRISAVLTANNIRQARALMEQYPVQLLLCDIDMPQGNGLELLEWVRERELDVECVFLSSYANFAYAQMAVRLTAREYLLKPISNAELESALERIVTVVEKKRKALGGQRQNPREELWENLLMRRVPEGICIRETLEKKICDPAEKFCLVLVRILESNAQETEKKDIAIFDFVIRNISSEYLGGGELHSILEAIVHISDLDWMLVLQAGEPSLHEKISELIHHLRKGSDRQTAVYIGQPMEFPEIGESRARLEHMEQNAVLDEDAILYEESWVFSGSSYTAPPWEVWEKEMLQAESVVYTRDKILGYFEEQKQGGGWCKTSLSAFLRELVQMLYKYLMERGCSYAQLFDDREFVGYEKAALDSEAGTKAFILYIFEKLEGNSAGTADQVDVIRKLKDYIEQHLGEDLSRTVLAQEVYLSAGYISKIFLKETGISIPSYIAERRIEKAKEYLEYSTLPVSRIATEVGYNNFSYFSKTFRDLTGCTPNEYRMQINKK